MNPFRLGRREVAREPHQAGSALEQSECRRQVCQHVRRNETDPVARADPLAPEKAGDAIRLLRDIAIGKCAPGADVSGRRSTGMARHRRVQQLGQVHPASLHVHGPTNCNRVRDSPVAEESPQSARGSPGAYQGSLTDRISPRTSGQCPHSHLTPFPAPCQCVVRTIHGLGDTYN